MAKHGPNNKTAKKDPQLALILPSLGHPIARHPSARLFLSKGDLQLTLILLYLCHPIALHPSHVS